MSRSPGVRAAWHGAPVAVVGGSGRAHVITESGCVLVDDGFVRP